MLGTPSEAVAGRTLAEALPVAAAALGEQGLCRSPSALDVELPSATGLRRFHLRISPRWGTRGTYQGMVLLLRLPAGEAERELWDGLRVGLCEWQPEDGRILFCNRILAGWLGGLRADNVCDLATRLGGVAVDRADLLPPVESTLAASDGHWLTLHSLAHPWTGRVLTIVRREVRGEEAPVCLCRLVDGLRVRLAPVAAARGVTLGRPLQRHGCEREQPRVWASRPLLEELVLRLLLDAIEAQPPAGRVAADFAWTRDGCSLWVDPAGADLPEFCRWAAEKVGGYAALSGRRAVVQLPCRAATACQARGAGLPPRSPGAGTAVRNV